MMLDRRYTFIQWVCLTALGFGVAIVVLGEKSHSSLTAGGEEQNMTNGLLSVLVACFSSAFAGVYFEFVLKKPSKGELVSLWMRNFQLAFFSSVIAGFQILYENHKIDVSVQEMKPILYGFDFWVWVLVALQAGGGLLIAAIIKYADNVLKGLSTGVAVAVSTFCSMLIFGTPITLQFAFGATIILTSVYWFSNGGTAAPKKEEPSESLSHDDASDQKSSEMKPMLALV
jgi:UDP-sugar transporter A1/2/3